MIASQDMNIRTLSNHVVHRNKVENTKPTKLSQNSLALQTSRSSGLILLKRAIVHWLIQESAEEEL